MEQYISDDLSECRPSLWCRTCYTYLPVLGSKVGHAFGIRWQTVDMLEPYPGTPTTGLSIREIDRSVYTLDLIVACRWTRGGSTEHEDMKVL